MLRVLLMNKYTRMDNRVFVSRLRDKKDSVPFGFDTFFKVLIASMSIMNPDEFSSEGIEKRQHALLFIQDAVEDSD